MKVKSFRFNFNELGGALGDLGTLLPLLIALISVNKIDTTAAFFVVGATYVLAGLYYRLPMPVQPLKAVSAIAITSGLSVGVIAASGLWMGIILLFLAWTRSIALLASLFDRPLIRGIQLGLGLLLLRSGLTLAFDRNSLPNVDDVAVGVAHLSLPASWVVAAGGIALLVLCLRTKLIPASIALVVFGVGMGLVFGSLSYLGPVKLGLALPAVAPPALQDLWPALVLLVIPQIPLTLGNAVIATADTAKQYFGDGAQRVNHRSLLTSMGLANLGAALVGGMPVCHGSGGLTAHFKLGARTGGASLFIGGLCLFMAVFIDGSALPLMRMIPLPVLGVLLLFVGFQHATLVRDLRRPTEIALAVAVAAVSFATGNLAVGTGVGLLLLRVPLLLALLRRPIDHKVIRC